MVCYGSDSLGVPGSLSLLEMLSRSPGGLRTSRPPQRCPTFGNERGGRPPAKPLKLAPAQGRRVRSQSSRPSPARLSGRRHYLDKTSRSSSADSSRSRVLLPPAVPELPPGRSFSFSPLEDAAMLLTGPQPAPAQLCAGEEAGSGGGRKDHRGGEAPSQRPLRAWRSMRAPAPSAGPERASWVQP